MRGGNLYGREEGSRDKADQTSDALQACMFMGDKLLTPCTTFKLCCEIRRLIMDPERSGCGWPAPACCCGTAAG